MRLVLLPRIVMTLLVAELVSSCLADARGNHVSPTATIPAPSARPATTSTPIPILSPTPPPSPASEISATLDLPSTIDYHQPDVLPEVALDVELFYAERWMRVRQVVEMENTTAEVWEEVVFNVPIHTVPDAFWLDTLTVTLGEDIQEGTPPLPGSETILHVPLPRQAQPGEAIRIEMGYRVIAPPVASTDWPPIGTTGWTFDLIQAGEWYPALVPYVEGAGWYVWPYHPVGDPTVYPLTNISLAVRTEEGITVVSGGALGQDSDGAWRFRIERARGVAFFASDHFQASTGAVNGIPVVSYSLADHALSGQAALDIAIQSLALFEELYGPYPYDSLTVVENGFFGGMEYSALISVTDYAYYTYPGGPPSILHALVSHEVAHQWWYGAVGNDQANEPWLDESLAFYSELLYFERYYPDLTDWWWEKRVFKYDPHGPVDATIYSYDTSRNFILSMYGQAAQFMHALRRLMGDEAFFDFLHNYYTAYQWQMVTADDFFAAVRRHTDQDLRPLLMAYFANPDH